MSSWKTYDDIVWFKPDELKALSDQDFAEVREDIARMLKSHTRWLDETPDYIEDHEFDLQDNLDLYDRLIKSEAERRAAK